MFVRPRIAAGTEPTTPGGSRTADVFQSDDRQRRAAVAYELARGRQAVTKQFTQIAYDVESVDPVRGVTRRIEVKGMKGSWIDNASVVLSHAQFSQAWKPEPNFEYWLYVVDETESDEPRIFPIPWPRVALEFGFYARNWRLLAEAERLRDTPPQPQS